MHVIVLDIVWNSVKKMSVTEYLLPELKIEFVTSLSHDSVSFKKSHWIV